MIRLNVGFSRRVTVLVPDGSPSVSTHAAGVIYWQNGREKEVFA